MEDEYLAAKIALLNVDNSLAERGTNGSLVHSNDYYDSLRFQHEELEAVLVDLEEGLDDEQINRLNDNVYTDIVAKPDGDDEISFEDEVDVPTKAESETSEEEVWAQCAACAENLSQDQALGANCDHLYCETCLRRMVIDSVQPGSTRCPPQCCNTAFNLQAIERVAGPRLYEQMNSKITELRAQGHGHIYCSERTCGKFIIPEDVDGKIASCFNCDAETCTQCKKKNHYGNCPVIDTAAEMGQMRRAARRLGYKNCRCGLAIERIYGCNHMTCNCGHEFCYVCEVDWEDCKCADDDEEENEDESDDEAPVRRAKLESETPETDAAPQYVEPVAYVPNCVARERRYKRHHRLRVQSATTLRESIECRHAQPWAAYRQGEGGRRCPLCTRRVGSLWICMQCRTRACAHCRRMVIRKRA